MLQKFGFMLIISSASMIGLHTHTHTQHSFKKWENVVQFCLKGNKSYKSAKTKT